MSAPTHNRYPYSPIPARAVYDWPGDKRLAIYVGLNLEWFSFGEGLGAELAPGGPQPDVLNYAWRDYGNRVGVFRLAELFGDLQVPVSLLVNSEMYRHAPETIAAFADAELVGHGRTNSERQGELTEYQERLLIEETTAEIERHSGQRPRGWLGPWISQ
ncbi:MAG: polysaccharide deacetylase, partial [Pseudolabrys sp.]